MPTEPTVKTTRGRYQNDLIAAGPERPYYRYGVNRGDFGEVQAVTTRELLREKCLKAFQNYAEEAGKTCELLGDLEDRSVPLDRLLALLAQTQAEDQAQEAYLLLRQQLFEVF